MPLNFTNLPDLAVQINDVRTNITFAHNSGDNPYPWLILTVAASPGNLYRCDANGNTPDDSVQVVSKGDSAYAAIAAALALRRFRVRATSTGTLQFRWTKNDGSVGTQSIEAPTAADLVGPAWPVGLTTWPLSLPERLLVPKDLI